MFSHKHIPLSDHLQTPNHSYHNLPEFKLQNFKSDDLFHKDFQRLNYAAWLEQHNKLKLGETPDTYHHSPFLDCNDDTYRSKWHPEQLKYDGPKSVEEIGPRHVNHEDHKHWVREQAKEYDLPDKNEHYRVFNHLHCLLHHVDDTMLFVIGDVLRHPDLQHFLDAIKNHRLIHWEYIHILDYVRMVMLSMSFEDAKLFVDGCDDDNQNKHQKYAWPIIARSIRFGLFYMNQSIIGGVRTHNGIQYGAMIQFVEMMTPRFEHDFMRLPPNPVAYNPGGPGDVITTAHSHLTMLHHHPLH